MKIHFLGFNLTNPHVAQKFLGMYEGWFAALRTLGAEVSYSPHDVPERTDVVISGTSWPGHPFERAAAASSAPIALYAPTADLWFEERLIAHYRPRLLFAFGPAHSEETEERYGRLGLEYRVLPLATDASIMSPLSLGEPPPYDFVFAGGLEHRAGKEDFVAAFLAEAAHRRDLLVCTGAESYGIRSQMVTWGELLNLVYNSARVGVNFHSAEQKQGVRVRLDANNRLFDLAAAGCFQVSDNPAAVRRYFAEDEVLAFDDPHEWIEAAEHFRHHYDETGPYRERARKRVLAEHTWEHRSRELLEWLREGLEAGEHERAPTRPPVSVSVRRAVARMRRLGSGV